MSVETLSLNRREQAGTGGQNKHDDGGFGITCSETMSDTMGRSRRQVIGH